MAYAKFNVSKVFKDISKNLKFIEIVTLTKLAVKVHAAETSEIKRVFKSPTRHTQNAVFKTHATKAKPRAKVGLKDFFGKGTPASKYLGPNIEGGARHLKRSEVLLRAKGILPQDKYLTPAPGLKLNKYGNVTPGKMTKIISTLKAFNGAGFNANQTAASRARAGARKMNLFISNGGKLPAGIWQRTGKKKIKPLFWFASKPNYNSIFKFYKIADRIAEKEYNRIYSEMYDKYFGK